MKLIRLFTLLTPIAILFSCNEAISPTQTERDKLLADIDTLASVKVNPQNTDSVRAKWTSFYGNPKIEKDTLLYAKVNYNIARFYGMQKNDSVNFYIEKALGLIEPTKGNDNDKILIYYGMGNASNQRAFEHQANYYYNKASTIILSNPALNLKPALKCMILLAAAQSNAGLYQYNLAYKMNLEALKLMPQLPPNSVNQQRVLHQLISVIYAAKLKTDSVVNYLKRLEELQTKYPDEFNPRFLYDSKMLYFDNHNQVDSIIKYALPNTEIDEEIYRNNPTEATSVSNLYTSYTNLFNNYTKLRDYKNAGLYAQKANELYKKANRLIEYEELIRNKKVTAVYYTAIGHSNEALNSSLDALELQKESFETENIQAIAEMGSLYQLKAKDQSISQLNKNIKINELELKENRLWLIISVLAFILLLLLSAFIYYRNRQQRYNQEREKTLTQQQLLRTQMEPHFIFNTLAALQSSIRLDKKEEAISYLSRFSRLLRSSLELSREQTVPLGDEIEALENYLDLQQMRFENAFSWHMHIPAHQDIEMLMLPPMLIQPFVENAIVHGIDLTEGTAKITINFELKDNILIVSIADTGNRNPAADNIKSTSLSGTITRERIRLFGKNARIDTSINKEGGTTVILQIPIEQG